MNGFYRSSRSGARGRGGAERVGSVLGAVLDQLWGSFEQRAPAPSGGGDVRAAVLAVLAEQPMAGARIIRAIEERSHGMWKPSPGSVYPTLQLLADEGLVIADGSTGRKIYSLTDIGRAEAQAVEDRGDPWDIPQAGVGAIPRAGARLAQAAAQVAGSGSPEQIAEAVAALDEARRKLYSILARS